MKTNTYIPKAGDIVVWKHRNTFESIAVMMNEDEFSVCLNYRGHRDETERIWEWDNIPTDLIVRKADKDEMAWLFSNLVAQGYEFSANDGKVTVSIDSLMVNREPDIPEQPEVKVECVAMTRHQRFAKYVYELVELYQSQGSFRNMSDIARNNNVSAIRKDICFLVGLHQLRNKQWLKTTEGMSFCMNLYEYSLKHTTRYPLIPQSQR